MELRTALGRRRMVRSFLPDPLEVELVDDLLDRARRAPSAGNTQATGFIVLDTPAAVSAYWDTTLPEPRRSGFRWHRLLEAPVLVVVTTEPGRYLDRYAEPDKAATGRGSSENRWPVPYWWVDAGAVIENLLLLATEAGLGACLFGPFDHEAALRPVLDVPDGVRLVATIAIGRPGPEADEPGRSADRARPPLDEVVTRPAVD